MSRAHNPVTKNDLILFCRNHIDFFEVIHSMNEEDIEYSETAYKEWRRRYKEKKKEMTSIITTTFNYKDAWGAIDRICTFYSENRSLIKNGFIELSESDKKAIDEYSFQVPFNGTNEFYDKEKAKHFEAGIRYARSHK